MLARFLLCLAFVIAGSASTVIAGSTGNLTAAETPGQVGGDTVARLCEEGVLSGGHVGVMAVRVGRSGAIDTIAFYNAQRHFAPASNLKLVTTGAALQALGPTFRFTTSIGYSGYIDSEGVLHGDVYICGGGDPTLGAKYESSQEIDSVFGQWKALLDKAGIRAVEGCVIGDGRVYDAVEAGGDWTVEDIGFYYGAPAHGLNFYENAIDFSVCPGDTVGEALILEQVKPQTPWLMLSTPCITGVSGSGDKLLYEASTLLPVASMSGTLAVDKRVTRESVVNHFPEYTCAEQFCEFLQRREGTVDQAGAIPISGGPADIGPGGVIRRDLLLYDEDAVALPADSLVILGRTFSPSLSSIITETNHESDNLYADALLKTLGLRLGGSSSFAASLAAEKSVLAGILDGGASTAAAVAGVGSSGAGSAVGDGLDGIQIVDGSGLSRRNFLTPAFMVSFLKAMGGSPDFDIFLQSLPQPGRGTLTPRLRSASESVRRRIYMKSGSMDGVRCFSGYILPAGHTAGSTASPTAGAGSRTQAGSSLAAGRLPEGTVVFSVFTGDITGPSAAAYSAIDRIILELAR